MLALIFYVECPLSLYIHLKIYIFLTLHIYIFWVWYMCMIYMHISLAFMWCLLDRLVCQWIFSTCLTQHLTDPACVLSCFSRVRLCATLWTVTCRALSWDSPGKNTGVGSHSLLQGVFPTQELKPCLSCLLHRRCFIYRSTTWEGPWRLLGTHLSVVLMINKWMVNESTLSQKGNIHRKHAHS